MNEHDAEELKPKIKRKNYAKKNSCLAADTKDNIENDLTSKYFQKRKQVNTNTCSEKVNTNTNEVIKDELKANKGLNTLHINLHAMKSDSTMLNSVKQEFESPIKKTKWEPSQWLEQLDLIKKMRANLDAPVDTMGCETLASVEPNQPENVKRYHILVSLMISSQTKDEVTAKAMSELYKLPLNIETILSTDVEVIEKAIYPASFYKRKTQYIKRVSQILKDKYDYDIPNNIEELCKLPGVGPKMGYICMSAAWNNTVGIGVDTHVHRISKRLGWTKTDTKLPEQTRKELEEWLPQCHWNEINRLLVGFGQQTCRPIGPKCNDCLCKFICPSASIKNKKQTKKIKILIENE